MGKKPMTVTEMARMGGRARAAKYTAEQLAEFSKNAGRPAKLDGRARRRMKALLAAGKSQAECAAELGVSTRTIGRAVARMRAASDKSLGAHLSGRVARPAKLRYAAESLNNETPRSLPRAAADGGWVTSRPP